MFNLCLDLLELSQGSVNAKGCQRSFITKSFWAHLFIRLVEFKFIGYIFKIYTTMGGRVVYGQTQQLAELTKMPLGA